MNLKSFLKVKTLGKLLCVLCLNAISVAIYLNLKLGTRVHAMTTPNVTILATDTGVSLKLRSNISTVNMTRRNVLPNLKSNVTINIARRNETIKSLHEKATIKTKAARQRNLQIYINLSDVRFNKDLPQKCQGNKTFLMIYVHSSPENTDRRTMVRNTWGNKTLLSSHNAMLIFIMGKVENKTMMQLVEKESKKYRDVVQADFLDSYKNLTWKATSALKWVTYNCPGAVYVLKTDDDMVVHIHRLVSFLQFFAQDKWSRSKFLACHVWRQIILNRNTQSKWYVAPKEYPKDMFLKYCSGSAYIMSYDVVKAFHNSIPDTPFFWVDDYYVTGMLAKAAGVEARPINDRYLLYNVQGKMTDIKGKKHKYIFMHSPNATFAYKIWDVIS